VNGDHKFAQLAAGNLFTCGVTTTGALYCWGEGDDNRLGIGSSTADQNIPVLVTASGVAEVTAGWKQACALYTNGNNYCWGNNGSGRLGTGNTTNYNIPTLVVE
tara:strand:- start:288 stop:599 length:312 start_codon:yes stop_codon:yes gene_type:complete